MNTEFSFRGRDGGSLPLSRRRCGLKGWLAGLLAAALIVLLWVGEAWLGSGDDAAPTPTPAAAKRLTLARYFRLGYLSADARTLVAVGRWLLEPDEQPAPGVTNTAPSPQVLNTNLPTGRTPA